MAEQGGDTTNSNPYEGGAGGKFRKKPVRRQTTPYDRPNNNSKVGWLKNLVVGQASKLFAYGTNRLFGSVAPKQILLSTQDVVNPDAREVIPESAPNEELMVANHGHPIDSSNSNGISELEKLLKRNTFTRPEALRLIELLHSRAVEVVPPADESKNPETPSVFGRYDEIRNEEVKSHRATSRAVEVMAPADESKNPETPSVFGRYDEIRNEEVKSHRASSRAIEVTAPADEIKNPETPSVFGRYDEIQNVEVKSHRATSTPIFNSRVHEFDEVDGKRLQVHEVSPAELAKAYMGSRPSKVSPSMLGANRQVGREDTRLLSNIPFIANSPILPLTRKNSSIGAADFVTPKSRGRSALYNMARTPYSRVPASSSKGGGNNNNNNDYGSSMPSRPISMTQLGDKTESESTNFKRRSSYLDNEVGSGSRSIGPIRRIKPKQNLLVPRMPQSALGVGNGSVMQKISLVEANHDGNENGSVASTCYAAVPTKSTVVASKILQHLDKMSPENKSPGSKTTAVMDKSPFKSTPGVLHEHGHKSMEDIGTSELDNASQHTQKKRAFRMNVQEGGDVQYNRIGSVSLSKDKGPIEENNLSTAEGLKSSRTTVQPEVKSASGNIFSKTSEFSVPGSQGSNGTALLASEETNKAYQYAAVPSPATVFDKPNGNPSSFFASSSYTGDKFPPLTSESSSKIPEVKLDGASSFFNISAPNGSLKADIDLQKAADKIGKYSAPPASNGLFGSGISTTSAKSTLGPAATAPLSVSAPSAAEISQVTDSVESSNPIVLSFSSSNSGNDIFGHASSNPNNFQGSLHNSAKSNAFAGESVPPQGSSRPLSSTSFPPVTTNTSNTFGSSFSSSQPFNSTSVTPVSESTTTFMKLGSSSTANSVANTSSSFSNGASGIFNFVGSSSTSSAPANPFTSSSSTSSKPAPTDSIFSSTFNSSSPSTGFVFNSSSTPAPTNTAQPFSSPSASPNVPFGASFAPPITTPSIFGNTSSVFEASPGKNSDRMNAEDSMAEDPGQSSTPMFGQPAASHSPPGFTFGQAPQFEPKPFQFGSQTSQGTPNSFPVSNSPVFNAGGSGGFSVGSGDFSLGSGGGDKSTRKNVKVNRNKLKRK